MPREATGRKDERDTCFLAVCLSFLFSLSGAFPAGRMRFPVFPMNENIFLIVITLLIVVYIYAIKITNLSPFSLSLQGFIRKQQHEDIR